MVRRLGVLGALALFCLAVPSVARAQARPTAQEAQALLAARPELVAQLRQRLLVSGLSPEQVRARLRAEGYPETLLDAYMSGGAGKDSLPTNDVFNAVRALGISDSTDVEQLRQANTRAITSDTGRRVFDPRTGLPITTDQQLRLMPPDTGTRAVSERIFGLSLFRSATNEFQANLDGPVDANYRIGPGDRLVLILTGDTETTSTLDVTREGFVVIPQVGQLPVANLTLTQLESVLYSRLGRVYSGISRGADATTHFSITVSKLRSNQVFVVGDVVRPSSYRISSAGTALTALYAAGGPTDNGSLRAITIRRNDKTVGTLDVYDYLLRGDASNDIRLQTGDVVFVGVHGARVRVTGEVTRPATYELKRGETLADVIAAAGGLSATAGRRRVQIERILPPAQRLSGGLERTLIDVSGEALASGSIPPVGLEPGDVVRVFPVASRIRNQVRVLGNVWLGGPQARDAGLTLSGALRRAGGTKPDTYLGQVLISRLLSDSSRVQLRAILRDTSGATIGVDPPLMDDDEITVFSATDFRPDRFVAINGAVRKPGRVPYREGITLRDLVILANGLEERAYLADVEVARLPTDRTAGSTATTIRVPLDSTYLLERSADGHYIGAPGLPAAATSHGDFVLLAYDNVLVMQQPDWSPLRNVAVSGEVRFPGQYSIRNKKERITDLIARAGGLTSEANTDGAYFARRIAATSYQNRTEKSRGRVDSLARVGMDLAALMLHPDAPDNLLLELGDSLDVPALRNTIEVRGAVNSPTIMPVAKGQSLDYYIRAAGGKSVLADAGRAYVTQPNGKIESRRRVLWAFRVDPVPRGGATVYVPVRDTTSNSAATLQTFSIVTQLAATILTALAVLKR